MRPGGVIESDDVQSVCRMKLSVGAAGVVCNQITPTSHVNADLPPTLNRYNAVQ